MNSHETSQDLKKRLRPRLDGKHTDMNAYQTLFPEDTLATTQNESVGSVKKVLLDK